MMMIRRSLTLVGLALSMAACPPELGAPCQQDLDCASSHLCGPERVCVERDGELARRAQGPQGWGASEDLPETVKADLASSRGVVVRQAVGKFESFVACAADEQLVGGGCRDLTGYSREISSDQSSYPDQYAPQHTLGARWRCQGYSGGVRAFALCLRMGDTQ